MDELFQDLNRCHRMPSARSTAIETGTTHEEDKARISVEESGIGMYRLGSVGTSMVVGQLLRMFSALSLYVSLVQPQAGCRSLKQWNILSLECLIWLGFSGKTFTFSALLWNLEDTFSATFR